MLSMQGEQETNHLAAKRLNRSDAKNSISINPFTLRNEICPDLSTSRFIAEKMSSSVTFRY
jgi:hypothetical protein